MQSKTYLLYSDDRVDLKKEAYKMVDEILEKENIKYNKQDIQYFEDLKIDLVREIIQKSVESSYKGIKIFILNLNNIRIESANALLKIIEEPPKNTNFILLSKNLKLPTTILSRAIKIHIKPKKYEVDDKIYELLSASEKYLEKYLTIKDEIKLSDYECYNMKEVVDAVEEYFKDKENIYNKIRYEFSITYIIEKIKYETEIVQLEFIQDIIDILKNERNNTLDFLTSILIKSKKYIDAETYIYLVELKNMIKSNVSTKYILYTFIFVLLRGK